MCFRWLVKKHCVAKILLAIRQTFLGKYFEFRWNLDQNLLLFLFWQFEESRNLSGSWGSGNKNISVFIYNDWCSTSKAFQYSIDFYRGFFLYVISACIIVPYSSYYTIPYQTFNFPIINNFLRNNIFTSLLSLYLS